MRYLCPTLLARLSYDDPKTKRVASTHFDLSTSMLLSQGVYKHVGGGKPLGGHAVKIIGYGTENGQDYWLVANSWSPRFGEKGWSKSSLNSLSLSSISLCLSLSHVISLCLSICLHHSRQKRC